MPRRSNAFLWFRIGSALVALGLAWQMYRSVGNAPPPKPTSFVGDAKVQLNVMKLSVASYLLRAQRPLPLSDEKLLAAISGGSGVVPTDPWGTPIRYRVTEPQPGWFYLASAGPDRVFDTSDDIVDEFRAREPAPPPTTAPASQPR